MSELPDALHADDHVLWALIAVSLAMVFTLQAAQAAIEGAWPHERRPARVLPQERTAQPIWALDALVLLVGGILLILNLAMLAWKDLPHTESQVIGSILLTVAWIVFVLTSFDRLSIRHYLRSIGPVAPLAILVLLIVADLLLLFAVLDIRPTMQEVRDELPVLIAFV